MATITALQPQKNDADRVNVFLDGAYALAVSLEAALSLRVGQNLTDAQVTELRAGDEAERACQRALLYLGPRPRSQAEVERHLRAKGFGNDAIAAALARLADYGYLSDADFAQFWTENRSQFRPRSAAALRYELRQKGVAREVIDESLAGFDEDAAAWDAAAARLERWRQLPQAEFERKLSGYLARRGFDYETTRRIVRRAWTQLQE